MFAAVARLRPVRATSHPLCRRGRRHWLRTRTRRLCDTMGRPRWHRRRVGPRGRGAAAAAGAAREGAATPAGVPAAGILDSGDQLLPLAAVSADNRTLELGVVVLCPRSCSE